MDAKDALSRLTPEQLRALRRQAQAMPRQPRDGRPFPASPPQRRLWFLAQVGGDSAVYNVPVTVALRGELDHEAIAWALARVVERHESLRTTFESVDGAVCQRLHAALPFALDEADFSALPAEHAQAAADAALAASATAPFDLARGPLLRARLIRLARDHHLLTIVIHHIVCDGWSLAVLARELETLYSARRRGEADPLPPLPVQYADYAVWLEQRLSGERLVREAAYWRETLSGAPPLLELPTDRRRPAEQDFTGALLPLTIDAALTAQLRALGARHGATLYMLLLAAWAVVLSRLSGQTDLVIGSPVANRGRRETQDQIGFFVNTLALRLALDDDPTIETLLARTKAVVLAAQEHGELPFEQVVEQVNPARSLAYTPVFQVAFAWHNDTDWDLRFEGMSARMLEPAMSAAKFDLNLSMIEQGDAIAGVIEYATALFDEATIARHAGYLLAVLRGMVADDAQAASRLPLLDDAEYRRLVVDWNATGRDFGPWRPLHAYVEDHAAATPQAIAVTCGDAALDYAALNAAANRIAHWLRAQGVGRGTRVAICVQRSVDAIAVALGIMKSGGAYVPIDPAYPERRIAAMLADARPALVLVDAPSRAVLDAARAQVDAPPPVFAIDAAPAPWADAPATNPDAAEVGLGPDDTPYVIYTSGSTGVPKGVMARHGGVTGLMHALRDPFGLGPDARVLQFASFGFDAFVLEWVMAFAAGGSLHLAEPGETLLGDTLDALVAKRGITHALIPPVVLASMPAGATLASLHTLTCGGETVPPALLKRWNRGRRFINVYGPTESTVISTCHVCPPTLHEADTVPIGRPLANERVYVLDRWLQPVPTGVAGELCIGGVGVAAGYLHRPELTADRFVDSPFVPGDRLYRSGDLARWRADGTIEHLGRNDFQVKVRGYRIELGDIEAKLAAQPGVKEAVVLAREDVPGEKQLVAYYLDDGAAPVAPETLRTALQALLPDYMVPTAYVRMDAWPLTSNAKLDRRALPAPQGATAALARAYVAPRTPIEEVLADIWAEIIGVERVGVHDNFFDLGGHSLMAMRLMSAIRDTLGLDLPLKAFFEAPTVAQMGRALLPDED